MSIHQISGQPPAYLFSVEIKPASEPVVTLTARGVDPSDDLAFWESLSDRSRELLAQVIELNFAAAQLVATTEENAAA